MPTSSSDRPGSVYQRIRPASDSADCRRNAGDALQHQEARGGIRPVRQHTQHGEEVRQPLNLVEHDEPAQTLKTELGIGEPREALRVLKVEQGDGPRKTLGHEPRQRRLSDLARPQDADNRALAKQL